MLAKRIWLLPGLCTAAALIVSWSLLPQARTLWQAEPHRPPRLVEPEAARLQRLQPGQALLRVPLLQPCQQGALSAALDAGAPLRVSLDGDFLQLALPDGLPAGPHRILVEARGCAGDEAPRHSHVLALQLPATLPAPRLTVARGAETGGIYAQVRGTPGAEVELLLLQDGTEQPIGAVALLASGTGGVEVPLALEQAHLLRARQRLPAAVDPGGRATPSPLSEPPSLAPRAQLLSLPQTAAALTARLQVGARELAWSWDLTLPDGYLPGGGPLPPWRRLQGVAPAAVRIGPGIRGPFDGFECALRDAQVERLPGATRMRGQCRLAAGESMRTLLFHSGARFHLLVAEDPDLHLPAVLEVAPGPGARLAETQPPPQPGGRWQLDTGEPGPYLRFARRTMFPLVDMPEPAALLLHPARRIAEHAQEVIALVLRLLPLMILLPALSDRWLAAVVLLLLVGGAGSPLVWAGVLGPRAGVPPDPAQVAAAMLWELAALGWVVAAVRSRGLLRSAPKTLLFVVFLALPLFWLYVLWHRPLAGMAGRGGAASVILGAGLAALALLGLLRLARLAGLAVRWQVALVVLGLLVLVMDGLDPAQLYVDAVARRLGRLAPALAALAAAVLYQRGTRTAEELRWPLFLATVPPLAMDHGLPLGLLAALLVFKLWRDLYMASPVPRRPDQAGDKVPVEVEAVLLALGDHPVARLDDERKALEERVRRGEVQPEAYRLAQERLKAREDEAVAAGYERRFEELPPVLGCGTAAGPVADAARAVQLALAPTVLYLLFLLLVKESFDPGRLLQQLLGSLRLIIQIVALCFFFGFAFGVLPGKNGLIKAMAATLLTVACELPSAVLTWYRPEDVGRGLVRWVGVLGILGWVGLGGFDLHRLRQAGRGPLDLARVRGYSRGFALTTSVILAIFTAVVSGVSGRLGALLTTAVVGPESPAITAPLELAPPPLGGDQ